MLVMGIWIFASMNLGSCALPDILGWWVHGEEVSKNNSKTGDSSCWVGCISETQALRRYQICFHTVFPLCWSLSEGYEGSVAQGTTYGSKCAVYCAPGLLGKDGERWPSARQGWVKWWSSDLGVPYPTNPYINIIRKVWSMEPRERPAGFSWAAWRAREVQSGIFDGQIDKTLVISMP